MGTGVSQTVEPVSVAEIQQRMQAEPRGWRRQYWQIILLGLTTPAPVREIARQVGVSVATVQQVRTRYRRGGAAALAGVRKGGRRRSSLPLAEEASVLAPFAERARRGEIVRVEEIEQALHARLGRGVHRVTVERMLARHGWHWRDTGRRVRQPAVSAPRTPEPAEPPPTVERRRRPSPGGPAHAVARYPSDLSDQEWARLAPLLPPEKPGGRPRQVDLREVLNALFYLDRTGCQWRALPTDFPPWSTVWSYFRQWRNDGTWQRLHTALREQVRLQQGRDPTPSAAIIDSQSVKTTQKGGGAAMTAARRSRGANVICWSIPPA